MKKVFISLEKFELIILESEFWEPSDYYYAELSGYEYIGEL